MGDYHRITTGCAWGFQDGVDGCVCDNVKTTTISLGGDTATHTCPQCGFTGVMQ